MRKINWRKLERKIAVDKIKKRRAPETTKQMKKEIQIGRRKEGEPEMTQQRKKNKENQWDIREKLEEGGKKESN